MQTVAVIGAGQMGAGIAQTVAQYGMKVLLSDLDLAHRRSGQGRDRQGARHGWSAAASSPPSDAEATLARITPVADYAPMAEAELIIEAATEREEIKRKIFEAAGKVLGARCDHGARTPARSRSPGWQRPSPDPTRFIGLHFFNPVPVMGLIEVIPGLATGAETDRPHPRLRRARSARRWSRRRTSPASSSTASSCR